MDHVVAAIMERPGPVRLVAVDGRAGAGKSTFAGQLAAAAGGATVIPTDDFASWDDPIDWWPRMLTQVVEPLVRGDAARYQRFDWPTGRLAEWVTVEPAPIVIIEGVSSGRSDWSGHLSFLVWVEAPAATRLSRGLERDGQSALGEWQSWMATEDAHHLGDATRERADLEIDGTSPP